FNLNAAPRTWHRCARTLQLYVHRDRLFRIDRDILLDKSVPIVGYEYVVRADLELDGLVAVANGFAVDKCVSLLGGHRNLQFSWFCVLGKGNRAEDRCGKHKAKCFGSLSIHNTPPANSLDAARQLAVAVQPRYSISSCKLALVTGTRN